MHDSVAGEALFRQYLGGWAMCLAFGRTATTWRGRKGELEAVSETANCEATG